MSILKCFLAENEMEIEEARIRSVDELPEISSGISKKRNRMNEESTTEKLIELIILT